MQSGLFGKLPAKRDFIAYGLTRPFLDGWEQWLQAGIAESRHALGEGWKDIFLTMPIWRFWTGSAAFGQAAVGAIMPSVDGVGRYFPLTVCACAEAGECIAAAADPALDGWFAACEHALLGLLDGTLAFDPAAIMAAIGLPPVSPAPGLLHQGLPMQFWTDPTRSLQEAFTDLEAADRVRLNQQRALWWTIGGEHHPAQLISTDGAVPPALWVSFMTGQVAA